MVWRRFMFSRILSARRAHQSLIVHFRFENSIDSLCSTNKGTTQGVAIYRTHDTRFVVEQNCIYRGAYSYSVSLQQKTSPRSVGQCFADTTQTFERYLPTKNRDTLSALQRLWRFEIQLSFRIRKLRYIGLQTNHTMWLCRLRHISLTIHDVPLCPKL